MSARRRVQTTAQPESPLAPLRTSRTNLTRSLVPSWPCREWHLRCSQSKSRRRRFRMKGASKVTDEGVVVEAGQLVARGSYRGNNASSIVDRSVRNSSSRRGREQSAAVCERVHERGASFVRWQAVCGADELVRADIRDSAHARTALSSEKRVMTRSKAEVNSFGNCSRFFDLDDRSQPLVAKGRDGQTGAQFDGDTLCDWLCLADLDRRTAASVASRWCRTPLASAAAAAPLPSLSARAVTTDAPITVAA